MNDLDKKYQLILDYEMKFADSVALDVLDKPILSIWMILIPIIFIFYFYGIARFKNNKKAFVDQYIKIRKKALSEAHDSVKSGKELNIEETATIKELSDIAQKSYKDLFILFYENYKKLFKSEGEDYPALIKFAYQNKADYLLFVEQITKAEKYLNAALKPDIKNENRNEIDKVITVMEDSSERILCEIAVEIFAV